jgi:RNA polymerase sigma factor (sigma-70 family)
MRVSNGVTRVPTDAPPDRGALYARHYLALVRLAVQLVDDLATAEDVVQDVFASWPARSVPDDALRYLRAAVVNRCRSALRRRGTARSFSRQPARGDAEAADAELLRSERSRAILVHIRTLPRRQREVVVLRYYEDLGIAEIATVLGIRPTAVSTSLSRAIATLAARLGEDRHEF